MSMVDEAVQTEKETETIVVLTMFLKKYLLDRLL